jgi:nucleoside-diphosphate-sugar epimerase
MSPRMRFDLAVNVMTKHAYVDQRITIQGGGRQWRPFVHVADAAEAFSRVVEADAATVAGATFNVGSSSCNLQILNLALRVRDAVGRADIITTPSDPDSRDYNVSFEKIERTLGYQAKRSIDTGITEVLKAIKEGMLDPDDRRWYTLRQYVFLAAAERAMRDLAIDGRLLAHGRPD